MFTFERFPVYQRAQDLYFVIVSKILVIEGISYVVKDQLNRASLSISLNIAEGSGRYTSGEKRTFYTVARGSTHECVAIISSLQKLGHINATAQQDLYNELTEISKMLSGLIKNFDQN